MIEVKKEIGNEELIIETGKVAKQANGAVMIKCGGTVVLVTAVASSEPRLDIDYFPLVVNYQERIYAAGKIPGGFIKREGKPTDKEILISRLIDRPIRPLFPEGFRNEVQIIATTLSADQVNLPDILAINGASAALCISDIPFNGPIGAVRVGKINDEFIINPTQPEIEKSEIDLVVAGNKKGIVMVEGSAEQVSEDTMVEALKFAHQYIVKIIELQEELITKKGEITKLSAEMFTINPDLEEKVKEKIKDELSEIFHSFLEKKERRNRIEELTNKVREELREEFEDIEEQNFNLQIKEIFKKVEKEIVRKMILEEGKRIDGRGLKDIRPVTCEVRVLPRTHGSALFTRGQTQSLAVVTLGTVEDEQRLDDITGESAKSFMVHYNFPPFCVGEVGRIGAPSRREIGHGMLAERSLARVMPSEEEFPYTVRVVSEILESNGSSSMATVCSGCLALMDAGVPIKTPVAGIAMGLVYEGDKYAILTDILGDEDHLGDMDFKVAGTRKGITGFQMDIKIDALPFEIMKEALMQAKEARMIILDKMEAVIPYPSKELSKFAPRIKVLHLEKDKIALLIGPGGRTIKEILNSTGTNIFIEDDGKVTISGKEEEAVEKAYQMVIEATQDLEVGKIYKGKVIRVVDYGAFILLPGFREGLLHISKISDQHIRKVEDILKPGDEIYVRVIEIDPLGRPNLSAKDLPEEYQVIKIPQTSYQTSKKSQRGRGGKNRFNTRNRGRQGKGRF